MNRIVLNRQLVSAKSSISDLGTATNGKRAHAETAHLSDGMDRVSAAWMWRGALAISVMVWGAVIWALVGHLFHL